nr:FAD-dependent oxidoreductase [Blastopirellula sp. J2-11]
MIRSIALCAMLLATCFTARLSAAEKSYDVVIYGGTSAAIAAAVQVKRMGKSVIVVSPDVHLGGLTSGGLGWTDSGNKAAIGGISREFYQRVRKHYDEPSAWRQQKPEQYSRYKKEEDAMWVFEPHVAEQIFEDLVAEYKIPVVRDAWLDRENGVVKQDGKIVAIKTLDGETYRGKIFMDTTYEGDLMAAAGVSYFVGREANSVYDETMDGVQTARARSHQFEYPVDPYVTPGDPSSGLLPKISADPPGEDGEGDKKLQAYCFRTCLTTAEDNMVPFPKPDGYDANDYALLARYLAGGWKGVFNKFDPAPNFKTDVNNHGGFSFDNIGMNYDYPEATYERRQEIIQEHEDYQIGLLYFLTNDPSVPADIQAEMKQWGLSKDEFVDNHNWPHQLYIREARRMVSDFVMSEQYLKALKPTPESIGLGSYNMDSHNTQRYVDEKGNVRNEGDIQVSPGGAYPISYLSIVPKRDECENLLVPVCVSSSHIAYGSIRMEPVFMILGQSAATAAVQAIEGSKAVQDVKYDQLSERLLADGQVLEMARKPKVSTVVLRAEDLPGIVVDDIDAETVGSWGESSVVQPYVGSGYRFNDPKSKSKATISFSTKLKPGRYDVRVSYSPSGNRASNVPVAIESGGESHPAKMNQRQNPEHDKAFTSVGQFDLDGETTVTISNDGADGYVIADAVSFVPVKK